MSALPPDVSIRIASEEWEFEQIHRLNYRTFVEEIPQHAANLDGRLVDRFHAENTYVACFERRQLVGMLALRGRRPFSLDSKVESLDQYLPAGRTPIEARLLAIEPAYRKTAVFAGLFEHGVKYSLSEGYDLALLSATTRQLKLYRHLGCVAFGPLVGTEQARFQPMYLTLEDFGKTLEKSALLREAFLEAPLESDDFTFVPGPVTIARGVREAFARPPISHRGVSFQSRMIEVRAALCELTKASNVQVLVGSGTLANEVVAAQLALLDVAGLIVSNGEFGDRLVANATAARLRFECMRVPWGDAINLEHLARALERVPRDGWLWCVHHETSTGVLNPLDELKALCDARGIHLCVDCISSIGAVPVDLRGAHLATTASGKGLAAYPGLAMVFHDYEPVSAPDRLPGYLDLGHWAAHESVPHTHSSNLVDALAAALRRVTPARMERIRANATWLRGELRALDFTIVAPDHCACPAVLSIAADPESASQLGDELELRGFRLGYRSEYLRRRGWIQIALLGDPPRASLEKLVRVLGIIRARPEANLRSPAVTCNTATALAPQACRSPHASSD